MLKNEKENKFERKYKWMKIIIRKKVLQSTIVFDGKTLRDERYEKLLHACGDFSRIIIPLKKTIFILKIKKLPAWAESSKRIFF